MALWQSQPIQCKVVLAFMVKGLQAHLTADSQWLFSGGEMWIHAYFFVACVSYLQHFNPCRWHMDGSMVWKSNMAGCGPSFEHSLPPKTSTPHTLTLVLEMVAPDLDPLCKLMKPQTKGGTCRQPLSRTWCCIEVWWRCWSRHAGSSTMWIWGFLKATGAVQEHGVVEWVEGNGVIMLYQTVYACLCGNRSQWTLNTSFQFWLLPLSQQCSNRVRTLAGGKHHETTMTHLVAVSFGSALVGIYLRHIGWDVLLKLFHAFCICPLWQVLLSAMVLLCRPCLKEAGLIDVDTSLGRQLGDFLQQKALLISS